MVATQPLTDMGIGSPWSVARYGVPQRRGGEPPMNGIPVYIALTEEPTCVHTASRLPWQQIGSLVIAYMSLLSEEGDMIN